MRSAPTRSLQASFLYWIGALLFVFFSQSLVAATVLGVTQTPEVKTLKEANLSLDELRNELKEVQKKLQNANQVFTDQQLVELRQRLDEIQSQTMTIETALAPTLEGIKARLAELGDLDPDRPEAVDLKKQRDNLNKEVATIDGQLKITRLIAVEAKQSLQDLGAIRRQQFQAVLGHRGLLLFSSDTWTKIQTNLPKDWLAIEQVFQEIQTSLAPVTKGRKWFLASMALLWVVAWWYAWRRFIRFLLTRSQPTRLRRTLLATMLVGLYVLIPTGTLAILFSVFVQAEALSNEMQRFVPQLVGMVALTAFMSGLGWALLSPNKPTWRLVPLPEPVVKGLRWLPLSLSVFITVFWALQKLLNIIGSSISTLLLTNSLFAIGLNAIVGLAVWRAEKYYKVEGKLDLGTRLATSLHSLALKGIMVAIICSLFVMLFGYTALSNLIIQEVIWLGLVVLTAFLLFSLISDLAEAVLNSLKEESDRTRITERQVRTRSQFTLLLAGFLKIALLLVALTLIFLPFGEDPVVWLHRRLSFLMQGFSLGEVTVKPTAFLYTALVLIVGLWLVQILHRWLAEKYLPYTHLEQGTTASTARWVSYVGYVVTVMFALSTAGIGFERMAWIVSALSVGLGFGLQAVVQNFVSGLLLLAERTIKVGDWVSIGTDIEGNVRQINARATEIEMFDKSTIIVPNSEFIIKTVRNITLSNPMGRGRITVIMPVNVSAELVRQCLFDAAKSTEEVLTDPEPLVIIDGFESGGIAFSLFIYLPSPRLVNPIRSVVFFKVLASFEQLEISLHPIQRMEMVDVSKSNKTNDSNDSNESNDSSQTENK